MKATETAERQASWNARDLDELFELIEIQREELKKLATRVAQLERTAYWDKYNDDDDDDA